MTYFSRCCVRQTTGLRKVNSASDTRRSKISGLPQHDKEIFGNRQVFLRRHTTDAQARQSGHLRPEHYLVGTTNGLMLPQSAPSHFPAPPIVIICGLPPAMLLIFIFMV